MQVRAYDGTLRDAQGIIEVDRETFDDCSYEPEYVLSLLADPAQQAWIAETEGQIVGFVSAFETHGLAADGWEIDELAVRPAYQGRGIGTQLVAHALTGGKQRRGLHRTRSLIASGNIASQRAFARNGFAPNEDVDLMLYDVSGRVPRPPREGMPTIHRAKASAVAQCTGTMHSRIEALMARPDNIYLVAMQNGEPVGCIELLLVRTLQYVGLWIETVALPMPDHTVAKALFAAAVAEAKSRPEVDRAGYLAPRKDKLCYTACASEGFSRIDAYRIYVQELRHS